MINLNCFQLFKQTCNAISAIMMRSITVRDYIVEYHILIRGNTAISAINCTIGIPENYYIGFPHRFKQFSILIE